MLNGVESPRSFHHRGQELFASMPFRDGSVSEDLVLTGVRTSLEARPVQEARCGCTYL